MIKGIIFDLDGVIVDTAHYHFLAWRRLARELGGDLTETENERLKGVSRMDSLNIVLELNKVSLPENEKNILADKKNGWFVDYIERMKPEEIFPGVASLIAQLRKNGLKIALASSSKNAERVVELLKIRPMFDTIVDGTMITHSKPHPEIFLLAARQLLLEPHTCVVFEDAEAGIEAALRAGMKCIGVGSTSQLNKATKVIAKTGDFKFEMLEELN